MVVIERSPEQSVQIGRYVLRVLAVRGNEVVVGILDPDRDCVGCGESSAERCRSCGAVVCENCVRSSYCPGCAHRLG